MIREKLKEYAFKHKVLLGIYRVSIGKIKTKWFFNMQRKSLQSKGNIIIENINKVLNDAGAHFFIDCGSLLGMIRDGGLMSYDRDIDYGIYFDSSFSAEMLDQCMNSIGFRKHKEYVVENDVKEITYNNGIISVDFFKHEEENGHSNIYVFYRNPEVRYQSSSDYSILIMHRAQINAIKCVQSGGINIYVPANAEEYLESAYSQNWRTPDPTWRYFYEPGLERIEGAYAVCRKRGEK